MHSPFSAKVNSLLVSRLSRRYSSAHTLLAETSHIHNIPIEAGWAAKYAGLSAKQAVNLVSRNVEDIMGLDVEETKRDFVVWEGNSLEFGASVVLGVDGEDGMVSMCWPESN